MTATGTVCGSCGAELQASDKFCHECAAPLVAAAKPAEYKQVTVLFADVVHSMDIAAAVGAERLREIMAELADRCAAVVQQYGGTVDKFTGDGIMAVFGAPTALEDHAFRACLAALGVQEEAKRLAVEVWECDGVELLLRVGLNSGQVIAGEIGSGPFGYTAVGEQVGMAQRMESVAAPGGVMLGESTAHLVDTVALLGEPELMRIKGGQDPVPARQLLGVTGQHELTGSAQAVLVGRELEVATIAGLLDRSTSGRGCVVSIAGPAGIGKTRLVGEAVRLANSRDVEVFSTFCESHATDIAFRVVARLLRAAAGVSGLDDEDARARIRARARDAGDDDLVLVDDLLGIRHPDVALPSVDPDARRRRLTALINSVALARTAPALYIIEDVHWIDEVSESMFADFLTVIPQTRSMVLITYRPEYRGTLAHIVGAQTISLAPLTDSETTTLLGELLGPDSSVAAINALIATRAAGNPFFAQEIVRELAERGVLEGDRGAYVCRRDVAEVSVPATLQAAIAARIDRLAPQAKQTLNAAAVIGLRFSVDLLKTLGIDPGLDDLLRAEMIDQVRFTPHAEYAFRHPLTRTVAYQSQLKSDRAQLHRRVATTIEQQDQNAALIAEHLEAAGDLHAAFDWHMRAATWSTHRDIAAARANWRRARQVADRLPDEDSDRMSMRIAPRALLCLSVWRAGGSVADTGFDELRELTIASGDKVSLATAMAGQVSALLVHARYREASRLASELTTLIESIDDPTLTRGLLYSPIGAKFSAGEMAEVRRLTQWAIDLTDGDAGKGGAVARSSFITAITLRGAARCALGDPGWKADIDQGVAIVRSFHPTMRALTLLYKYGLVPGGALLPDAAARRETAELLESAERSGDNLTMAAARWVRGLVLVGAEGIEREQGFELLAQAREAALAERFTMAAVTVIDMELAREKARTGDLDGAIELARAVVDDEFETGEMTFRGPATTVLVESLLRRGTDADVHEANGAVERLASVPTDPGFVLHDIWLLRLRAQLSQAQEDDAGYCNYRDRYRAMATSLGFEGHIAWAEAMP